MSKLNTFYVILTLLILAELVNTSAPFKGLDSKTIMQVPMVQAEGDMCECAAFDKIDLDETSKPLLSQKLMKIACDDQGVEICDQICTEIALLTQSRGSFIVCAHFQHADKLKVHAFSRICDRPNWTYTGISTIEDICCHGMKVVDCVTGQFIKA